MVETYHTINLPKMLTYQVKISSDEFSMFLNEEWLKNDKARPQAKSFKGSKWFTAVQKAINHIEPDTMLAISKTRLYEDSKKATSYLTVNASCKLYDIRYFIKSLKRLKPTITTLHSI